jgi:hypothetical protein
LDRKETNTWPEKWSDFRVPSYFTGLALERNDTSSITTANKVHRIIQKSTVYYKGKVVGQKHLP